MIFFQNVRRFCLAQQTDKKINGLTIMLDTTFLFVFIAKENVYIH